MECNLKKAQNHNLKKGKDSHLQKNSSLTMCGWSLTHTRWNHSAQLSHCTQSTWDENMFKLFFQDLVCLYSVLYSAPSLPEIRIFSN